MRVIAGKYKGRRLSTPKNFSVRPTSDRVKESVFSILREHVRCAKVLDLCAGTGNIGIEALSRGAKHVTFLDNDVWCKRLIQQNLLKCDIEINNTQTELIRSEIGKGLALFHTRSQVFDLIYFDPPYDAQLYKGCLIQISNGSLLESSGILIVEHHKNTELLTEVGMLKYDSHRQYGNTCITFYRHQA